MSNNPNSVLLEFIKLIKNRIFLIIASLTKLKADYFFILAVIRFGYRLFDLFFISLSVYNTFFWKLNFILVFPLILLILLGNLKTHFRTGIYIAMSRRLSGFLCSGSTLPRIKYPIRTGTKVMESAAEAPIA